MKTAAVILAGGLATRMGGGDKGLLSLGDTTLLGHVIDRLKQQTDDIVLNANGNPERFSTFDLPVIADNIEGFVGPLGGILAGMDWAATRGFTHVVSVAADTPFFPEDLLPRLKDAARSSDASLALAASLDPVRGAMWQPTFGLWPVALRDDLRDALNDGLRKVVLWTKRHDAAQAVWTPEPFDPFFNINTPEDHAKARSILESLS